MPVPPGHPAAVVWSLNLFPLSGDLLAEGK
jgi:hypothetical protein